MEEKFGFDECVRICRNFLMSRAVSLMPPSVKDKDFVESLEGMILDIEKLKNDEEIDLSTISIKKQTRCVDFLMSLFVEQPIDDEILNFIKAYSFITMNWNEHLLKDSIITTRTSALIRFTDGQFTITESISLLREILQRFREVRNWMPPAFQASMKYLEALDRKISEENETEYRGC